ncbi:MAG TPA: hypothetical protein VK915_04955 [Gaiellaceae bacterium]|nr:hypothetical protein [Gaiellaceae bacterium]
MAHAVGAPSLRARLTRAPARPSATLEELLSPARWRRHTRNPELKKALGYVQAAVGELRRVLSQPPDEVSLRTPELLARLRDVLDVPVRSLRIDSAWELYSEIKGFLSALANADYVAAQLDHEAERLKDPSRWHAWTTHFSETELQELRMNYRAGAPDPKLHAVAAAKLAFLYARRAEAGRDRRAKAAQKCRYLNLLAPVLLALQAGLVVAIDTIAADPAVWKQILVAGTAGALGATLAGTMKIRDGLRELDDLRSFWPAMRVQPLVGATAGLIVLLVVETGTLDVGGDSGSWAGRTLVAFAAGFSEPFFLGLVQRVAVISDRRGEEADEPEPEEADAANGRAPERPPAIP